jgi:hypothetical protein
MTKKLSLVVPLYTSLQYFADCLESLENQESFPDQIVIVDDSNNSEVSQLAQNFAAKYSRQVDFVANNEPLGIVGSTARAIEQTSGDYIAFLDSDDVLLPNAVREMRAAMTDEFDVISSDFSFFSESPSASIPRIRPYSMIGDSWVRAVGGQNFSTHFRALRGELAREFDWSSATSGVQDAQLNFSLIKPRFKLIDQTLYLHRVHPSQHSRSLSSSEGSALNISRSHFLTSSLGSVIEVDVAALDAISDASSFPIVTLTAGGKIVGKQSSTPLELLQCHAMVLDISRVDAASAADLLTLARDNGITTAVKITNFTTRELAWVIQYSALPDTLLAADTVQAGLFKAHAFPNVNIRVVG